MKNISKFALSAKGYNDVNTLLEICNATPNPEVAVEMLLGTYQIPNLGKYSSPRYNNNHICEIVDFNPLADRVDYKCQEEEQSSVYYDPKSYENKDEAKSHWEDEVLRNENKDCFSPHYTTGWESFKIKTGEFKTRTSSCSAEDWIKGRVDLTPAVI